MQFKRALSGGALALSALMLTPGEAAAAPLTEYTGFGSNPGNLRLFSYVPSGFPANGPLVVVGHGCGQTAQNMADTSGWVQLADTYKIALIFPQTSTANEPTGGCFRTWQPAHQARDAGEPQSVKQMIDYLKTVHSIDANRIFVTGLSSGGHLTNVMLATYPDVFAAGAPHSSFPYKCATSYAQLSYCAFGQVNYTATVWGNLARSGYPGYAGPRPKVQIWHGSADALIYLSNQYQQVLQWTNVHGTDGFVDQYASILGQPHNIYKLGSTQVVETVTVQYMGHYQAVDPGTGTGQCGMTGTFAADYNICAAYWMGKFFGVVP